MADLRLDLSRIDRDIGQQYVVDEDDLQDEEGEPVDEIDPLLDDLSPDDKLSALEKLDKYFQSEDMGERELAVRLISEAMQTLTTYAQFELVLEIAFALANDHEPLIRIGVLTNVIGLVDKNGEQLEGEGEEYMSENEERLFDVPIRMLNDINQQVRRVSQNVIVNLLEEERGNKDVLLQQLCPIVKKCLGKDENYDLRMDTTLLLSRLASLLGRDLIIQHFISYLPSLSTDTMFHVRKAFAISCKELCPIVGEDSTEEHILPLFINLCKDEVWGVRKACADVFPDVSASSNLGVRHDQLTPMFLKLLHDDSRWVRKAAFQTLGAFISTFYVPNGDDTTSLDDVSIEPLSDSMLMDNSLLSSSLLSSTAGTNESSSNITTDSSLENRYPLPDTPSGTHSNTSSSSQSSTEQSSKLAEAGATSQYTSFEFWRSPVKNVATTSTSESDAERSKVVPEESGSRSGGGDSVQASTGDVCSPEGGNSEARSQEEEEESTKREQNAEKSNSESNEKQQLQENETVGANVHAQSARKTEEDVVTQSLQGDDVSKETQNESKQDLEATETNSNVGEDDDKRILEGLEMSASEIKSEEQQSSSETVQSLVEKNKTENKSTTSENTTATPPQLQAAVSTSKDRVRSSSASYSVRRDKAVMGLKRRRWSLDKMNRTPEDNKFPPVRVFVHSTNGQVMEHDVSLQKEPTTTEESVHDLSTNHSEEAMDLTLGSTPSDPILAGDVIIDQEVVPDELMEIYLSMNETARAQTVDTDLPFYCAFSLPGVALTIGKDHWPLLRPTFQTLSGDTQWKIRRALAFSLHELARVLGSEYTCLDLLPVFEEYCTKDIDDVKVGVLSHLTDFFELLPSELRDVHLPGVLGGLQDTENEKNWRYRNTFAEQLIMLCDLYDSEYLHTYVYPVALSLAEDKVAEVRSTASQLLGVFIQKLSHNSLEKCRTLLQELRAYSSNSKWLFRLMYVKQCESFLLEGRISCEMFASECLPTLIHLARDKVPNVRISVAKMLKDSVLSIDYFQTDGKETFSLEELQITLECLQHDADRDVKYFAGGEIVETPRLVTLPVHWYAHRTRSESSEFQDAPEFLDGDPVVVNSPISTQEMVLEQLLQHQHEEEQRIEDEEVQQEQKTQEEEQDESDDQEGHREQQQQDIEKEKEMRAVDDEQSAETTVVKEDEGVLRVKDTSDNERETMSEHHESLEATHDTAMESRTLQNDLDVDLGGLTLADSETTNTEGQKLHKGTGYVDATRLEEGITSVAENTAA